MHKIFEELRKAANTAYRPESRRRLPNIMPYLEAKIDGPIYEEIKDLYRYDLYAKFGRSIFCTTKDMPERLDELAEAMHHSIFGGLTEKLRWLRVLVKDLGLSLDKEGEILGLVEEMFNEVSAK